MYSERRAKVSAGATKALGERAVSFLRRRYDSKVAANVEAETGIPAGTVAKWLEGAATPGGLAMVRLICAIGPEFLCAVTDRRPDWLERAYREERQRALDAQIAELQARRAGLGDA